MTPVPEQRRSRKRRALWLAALGTTACDLYEGRSLDLFPPAQSGVECTQPVDCRPERPWCAQGSCVQCLTDTDCVGNTPACVGRVCVECSAARHCEASQSCNTVLNRCAFSCREASQCAGQVAFQCSAELALCVECLADADCTSPRAPACDLGGVCVECVADGFCPPDRPLCDSATRRCVECTNSSQCNGLSCDLRDSRCVDCLSDEDCAPTGTCDVERRRCLTPCNGDVDCEPKAPLCDESSGLCSQCQVDLDCADPMKSVCNGERQCVECASDTECTSPGRPACVTATQRCAECTRPEHCADGSGCDLRTARCERVEPAMPPPMPPLAP